MENKENNNSFLNYKSPSTKNIVSPMSKLLGNVDTKKKVIPEMYKLLKRNLLGEKNNKETFNKEEFKKSNK